MVYLQSRVYPRQNNTPQEHHSGIFHCSYQNSEFWKCTSGCPEKISLNGNPTNLTTAKGRTRAVRASPCHRTPGPKGGMVLIQQQQKEKVQYLDTFEQQGPQG